MRILLCALALLPACAYAQTLAITHVTLIDVSTGATVPNTTVLINANRITSVTHAPAPTSKATQVIDASGEYLIPGLWDMHTHVYFDNTAADGTDLILPLFDQLRSRLKQLAATK